MIGQKRESHAVPDFRKKDQSTKTAQAGAVGLGDRLSPVILIKNFSYKCKVG